jgi:hypothetical protein
MGSVLSCSRRCEVNINAYIGCKGVDRINPEQDRTL